MTIPQELQAAFPDDVERVSTCYAEDEAFCAKAEEFVRAVQELRRAEARDADGVDEQLDALRQAEKTLHADLQKMIGS